MSKEQTAPRQASDKTMDLKQYRAEVGRLQEEMQNHTFSFSSQVDNYRTYMLAQAKEREFLVRAQRLGKSGIDTYRFYVNEAIGRQVALQVMTVRNELNAAWQKRMDVMRNKYMQPIDFFREKLAGFDWTHPMSDSMHVCNNGADRQQKLIDEAIAGGDEFKRAFKEAYEKGWSSGNPGTVWDWSKYELLKKAVRK